MKNDKIRNKNRFFIQENSRNDININELINELMKIQNDQIFVQFFQLSVEKQQLLFMKLSEIVINENNDLHIIIKSIKLLNVLSFIDSNIFIMLKLPLKCIGKSRNLQSLPILLYSVINVLFGH